MKQKGKQTSNKKLKLVTLNLQDYKKLLFLKDKLQITEMQVIRHGIRSLFETLKVL